MASQDPTQTIPVFGGIVPRASSHLLKPTHATIADSVKLRNGRLEAWRKPCYVTALPEGQTAHSFHMYGCCPVLWEETTVRSADVHPDWGRFYITGRTQYLEAVEISWEKGDDPKACACKPVYYRVGVPAPVAPPVLGSVKEECSRTVDARSYVYTYVNKWGEESAPSPASDIVRVEDGFSVKVSITLPNEEYIEKYAIVGANLYRAATGWQSADGKHQKPMTEYLFVTFIEFPSSSFTDNLLLTALGPALETEKVKLPSKGLTNLVKIDGQTRLAGSVGNRVYFSEPGQPYSWPVRYELTLKSNIVHMVCFDQLIYVTTDTFPYVIDVSGCAETVGNDGMAHAVCTPVLDVTDPLPDISCVSAQSSAIATPFGAVYSSPIGVILIDQKAGWHILTAKWLSEDDWQRVMPHTARFAYWQGYLFISTDVVTFLLDINGDPYNDMKDAELSTVNGVLRSLQPVVKQLHPSAYETTGTGDTYFLQDGRLYVWNKGTEYVPFDWRSRPVTSGISEHFPSSAKVKSGLVDFALERAAQTGYNAPSVELFRRTVSDPRGDKPFRLPLAGRHLEYYVRLRGTEPVEYVSLAGSYWEVS